MNTRRLFGALLLGLPACVVDTPVAERTRSAEQELTEDLPDWCSDTCARVVTTCQDAPCGCDSESAPPPNNGGPPDTSAPPDECECDPPSLGDCAIDCRELMRGFEGQGEECALAGLASMRCIDGADTCDELEDSTENCFRSPSQIEACNGGFVTCQDSFGGTGGSGSVRPPVATAGSAPSGRPEPGGAGVSGSGSTLVTCQLGADACSDGSSYLVMCQGYEEIFCDCLRNGVLENTFVLPFYECTLPSFVVNEGCGWKVSNFE